MKATCLHITVTEFPVTELKEKTMAVPKSKISNSRRGMRQSHDALSSDAHSECQNCGELKRPHH